MCYNVWEQFYFLNSLIGSGCKDDDSTDRERHAKELEAEGARFVHLLAPMANMGIKSPYVHICGCHLGRIVRQWGSLPKWCSQATEAMHQYVKFYSKHRSNRKNWVSTTAKNMAVVAHTINEPCLRKRAKQAKQNSPAEGADNHAPAKPKNRGHAAKADVQASMAFKKEILGKRQAEWH